MSRKVPNLLLMVVATALCAYAATIQNTVSQPAPRRPHVRRAHVRRVRWNPVFRPSRESLLRQNEEIDRLELPRIQDDDELEQLKANEQLVPIVENEYLRIDPRLDPSRRYCRPWTRDFLEDFSEAFYKESHTQIQVNSAVRTVKVQKKLRRHNRNAAPADGDTASSHLAGVTVDVQRRGLTRAQIRWVQQYLMPLRDQMLIEPEEERRQWVFHIMVSDRYTGYRQSRILATQQAQQQAAPEAEEELTSRQH